MTRPVQPFCATCEHATGVPGDLSCSVIVDRIDGIPQLCEVARFALPHEARELCCLLLEPAKQEEGCVCGVAGGFWSPR